MLETINPQVVLLERFQKDHVRSQKSKGKEGQLLLLQTSLIHQLSCDQLCPHLPLTDWEMENKQITLE